MSRASLLWGCVAIAALVACSGAADGTGFMEPGSAGGGGSGGGSSGAGSGGAGSGGGGVSCGLPSDVQTILATYCTSCHSNPPVSAPMPLVTLADLTAPDKANPSISAAQASLARMKATTGTMPPGATVPAADLTTFANWVNGGAQPFCVATDGGAGSGSSSGGGGSGSSSGGFNTPTVCTSGTYSTSGSGSRMRPGIACIACHAQSGGEAPMFSIAGTVYPTAHEPDNCNGASGVTVVITGADGAQTTLTTNSAGSFSSYAAIALPYTAKVVDANGTRAMATAQQSGDCNSCHTEAGANGAPGRIVAP